MSKNIHDILFVTQARLESERVPGKMIRPFAGSNLLDILINKVKKSKIIPLANFYLSVHDKELIDLGNRHGIMTFPRSKESALAENNISSMFEWWNKLEFKYVVLLSACNPLLTIETIDKFVEHFLDSDKEGCFGVIAKKQYFWNHREEMISDWPEHQKIMNTKDMNVTYEAAHCLYASRMDIIGQGYWMDKNTPPKPELFVIENEIETFDIDYEWQFEVGEQLYLRK
tara:strand:+ start:273 stop:956 length:684 start_codon:yes stop_codon:yes gene_type:complete